MKCPILSMTDSITIEGLVERTADCLEERCAWWDKAWKRCAVLGLLHEACNLTNEVAELKEKLPKARQVY